MISDQTRTLSEKIIKHMDESKYPHGVWFTNIGKILQEALDEHAQQVRNEALEETARFLEEASSRTHPDHDLKRQTLINAARTLRNSKTKAEETGK